MKRVFIGVDISERARNLAAEYVGNLRGRFPGVRAGWERPEKMHLTIKFLGDTNDEQLDAASAALLEITGSSSPFRLRLNGTGVFPTPNNARVLWLGIDDPDRKLAEIAASVDKGLANAGFTPEKRPFRSHLTIARIKEPRDSRDLVAAHLETKFEPVEFEVGEIILYESQLKPTGSVYCKLAMFPLAAG